MSTQVQDIINRAVALSVANQGLATNQPDLIYRVNQFQRKRWTQFTQANKYYYQITQTVTSTAANGGRVADLSTLSLPVERTLSVYLPSGIEVREVDLQDQNAELAPRYYPSGATLVEVTNDWDTATPNAVILIVNYCWRPVDLDPTMPTTQLVSVPDGYVGCLVNELGAYFAFSDFGRATQVSEATQLMADADSVMQAWIGEAGHFAGHSAYRFELPDPSPADKK